MHLRTQNAQNTVALRKCNVINQRLRSLLDANHIPIPPDLEYVDDSIASTDIEVIDAAHGLHRLSPLIHRQQLVPTPISVPIDVSDAQIAIEFILTLEQPCLDHIHAFLGEDNENGHRLMLQASVIEAQTQLPASAIQPLQTESTNSEILSGLRWSIPAEHLEAQLQRLLVTSQKLNLTGELTPVMCWSLIRDRAGSQSVYRETLDHIQRDLSTDMVCYG